MKAQIKNWAEFQHYKDRRPTWIKLHLSMLDDYEWWELPVASRALAPMLWLLAADTGSDGTFDADHEKLAFRFRMSRAEIEKAISPLVEGGWVILYHPASKSLAGCYQDASLETETETETETERETDTCPAPETSDAGPVVVSIPLAGKDKEHHVTQADIDALAEDFAGIDIVAELRAIRRWNMDNPGRRKTARGIRNHISTWLHKACNQGRTAQHAVAQHAGQSNTETPWALEKRREAVKRERDELYARYGFAHKSSRAEYPDEYEKCRELTAEYKRLDAQQAGVA